MSYLEDSIDWQAISDIDAWLDNDVSSIYHDEPLAQDWARVAKIGEELGEAINELILATGQNPRKGLDPGANDRMLGELADVIITGILAIQHFTKNSAVSRQNIRDKIRSTETRMRAYQA